MVLIFVRSYSKLGDDAKCPTRQRIKSATACMKAASELGLSRSNTWLNPYDVPGCIVVVVVVVVGKLIYPSSGVMSYYSVSVYSVFREGIEIMTVL